MAPAASVLSSSVLWLLLLLFGGCSCFEWAATGRPEVDRRAIAGIWKLTPLTARKVPMKEFTVYPKPPVATNEESTLPELLLMLKEDGSFLQYTSDDEPDDEDLDQSWTSFQNAQKHKKKQHLDQFIKGTWDFLDGNLILAADRPSDETNKPFGVTKNKKKDPPKPVKDTLLKGRVVASYQTRLEDNPVVGNSDEESNNNNQTSSSSTALDTHLSVPKGSINVGKFFYPKNHPSFFEQPMFQPKKKGTFALRQVLGSLNTEHEEEQEPVEKFQRSDFYNKTFLLTSQPIGVQQPPKGNMRWSIKYNKFVHDNPKAAKSAKAAKEAQERAGINIRVLEIAFHANNTFSTVAGLGEAAILRGKFDVIGTEKDHLWMQVVRFGFGRSVSGSVYSEGRMLSHEDAKAYWGKIFIQNQTTTTTSQDAQAKEGEANAVDSTIVELASTNEDGEESEDNEPFRLEVTGSVLDGWGLEPLPVARFIMREKESDLDDINRLLEEEDEEDDEEDDEEMMSENMAKLDPGIDNDGIDWESSEESFQ